jgi:hypothetical protein
MAPAGPGEVVSRTGVTLPAEQAGADPDGQRGFLATARWALSFDGRWLGCDLPPATGDGPRRVGFADLRTTPAAVRIVAGTLPEGGAVVAVGEGGARAADGTVFPAGHQDSALGPREYVAATWHAPAAAADPLLRLAVIRGSGRWSLEAYDGGRTRWGAGSGPLRGEPAGLGITPDGSAVLVSLVTSGSPPGFELIALDAATGEQRWRAPIGARPIGRVLASSDVVGVLARDTARCASCLRLALISAADGRPMPGVALPPTTIAEGATSAGLSSESVWFYRYVPAHMTSELAPAGRTPVATACQYEVYDLGNAAAPVRTLAQADGEWRRVSGDCRVRSLVPLHDGHVAAITVVGESRVEVIEFNAAP